MGSRTRRIRRAGPSTRATAGPQPRSAVVSCRTPAVMEATMSGQGEPSPRLRLGPPGRGWRGPGPALAWPGIEAVIDQQPGNFLTLWASRGDGPGEIGYS